MSEIIPRVIIVGAGFGGTNAAHALRRARVRVTVRDRARTASQSDRESHIEVRSHATLQIFNCRWRNDGGFSRSRNSRAGPDRVNWTHQHGNGWPVRPAPALQSSVERKGFGEHLA